VARKSYIAALTEVLQPEGFSRDGQWWSRTVGTVLEQTDLQRSSVAGGGVTVNLWSKDLETEKILQGIECERPVRIMSGGRISSLVPSFDGYDRWWRNDPDGPLELAGLVRVYGLPWLEGLRSLEAQAKQYGRGGSRQWRNPTLAPLAVTLYRLGAIDEALALFEEPAPKTAIPSLVSDGRCVQRWLRKQKSAAEQLGQAE